MKTVKLRYYTPILLLVFILAAIVRFAGIFDQFWLDEIWSLQFVALAHGVVEIITGPIFHHANNHWLYTIYMYLLGPHATWAQYRLLSLATGIGIVAAVWIAARRWSREAGLLAAVLAGFSYMLVHYSSEARGYAPAGFFALISFLILRRFILLSTPIKKPFVSWILCAGFGLSCILGLLFHATFFYVLAGALVWAPIALSWRKLGPGRILLDSLALFTIPGVFLIWLYLTAIRGFTVGDGTHSPVTEILGQAVAYTFGLPVEWANGWVCIACVIVVALYGAWSLFKQGRDEWIFFLVAGVVTPGVTLAVSRDQALYPRHVFVAVPFVILLAVAGLLRLRSHGHGGQGVAVALVLAFLVGNSVHIGRFLWNGRGHYAQAVQYIADHSAGPVIPISGNQEWRTMTVLDYYAQRLMDDKRYKYVNFSDPVPPQWLLLHSQDVKPVALPVVTSPWGPKFGLVAIFPYYGLSGWHWLLYRQLAMPTTHPGSAATHP